MKAGDKVELKKDIYVNDVLYGKVGEGFNIV